MVLSAQDLQTVPGFYDSKGIKECSWVIDLVQALTKAQFGIMWFFRARFSTLRLQIQHSRYI